MGSEFKTECTTKDGEKVEIVYNEQDNTWDFKINKRVRTRTSLVEAKQCVSQYATDVRVRKEKVKFEKFKALQIAALPYRLGHLNSIDEAGFQSEVDVVGLAEEYRGAGSFNMVTIGKNGNTAKLNLRNTARDKSLVYMTGENLKALEVFNLEMKKLFGLMEVEQEKMNEASRMQQVYENEFSKAKSELNKALKPIETMDEFDWNVMSTREARKQSGEV